MPAYTTESFAAFREALFVCTIPDDGWPDEFAIITACNPQGRIVSNEGNVLATDKLREQLKLIPVWHWPVTGASSDLMHQELGFAAQMSFETARKQALDCAQLAFFWIARGKVELHSSDGFSSETIGSWSARLRFPENVARILAASAEAHKDRLWENSAQFGIWVRFSDTPDLERSASDPNVRQDIASCELDESRAAAILSGSALSQMELEAWRRRWMENQLLNNDADKIPGYALAEISDFVGNRGYALLLRTGYSFTRLRTWVEGAFPTVESAWDHMNRHGICD